MILRQADQAQQSIANARRLRKSTDAAVRDYVYFNPYLTRSEAEAEAAYKEARLLWWQSLRSRNPSTVSAIRTQ